MTEMSRTIRGTRSFLLLPFLFIIAASGCGESASSGATGESDNTGGAGAGTGGASTGGTSTGTGGTSTASTSAGTGGAATGSTSAGTGGGATGGPVSSSSGAGTGGAPSSGSTFHIFMLMGQSNMAGVADKQASDQNSDERLKVLGGCNQPAGQWNLANPPLSDCPGEKGWNLSTSVDPGIWFGKTLLGKLPEGDTIGLVATAESGESINTFITGGSHHQMILNKIAKAKTAENARFAGIIFHQGESDSGQSSWPGKVVQLYNEVKEAWGVDYDVPFILGELPAGGCCSGHNNLVHQAADMLPDGYWITQQGTNVMDQYHFDHASVVLMGTRYGEKMIEALGW
ncbi:hypothetical protein BE11_34830 [Sorangium cellulosum]|nr:hypothetical protein BE11_34830 [Sorangium cellulosum]